MTKSDRLAHFGAILHADEYAFRRVAINLHVLEHRIDVDQIFKRPALFVLLVGDGDDVEDERVAILDDLGEFQECRLGLGGIVKVHLLVALVLQLFESLLGQAVLLEHFVELLELGLVFFLGELAERLHEAGHQHEAAGDGVARVGGDAVLEQRQERAGLADAV